MGLLEMVRRKAQQGQPNLSVYTDYLTVVQNEGSLQDALSFVQEVHQIALRLVETGKYNEENDWFTYFILILSKIVFLIKNQKKDGNGCLFIFNRFKSGTV